MRETSELYKRLLDNDAHVKESRLIIGGTVYEQSQIVSLSTSEPLFAEDTMSIGGAVAREIDFAAFLDDSVPKRAQIIHEVRLRLEDEVSEWLPKGVYYIDTRSRDPLTGVTAVHGFDAMLMAEQEWIPPAKDKFPMNMKEAVELTAATLKLAIDPRTTFKTGDAYKVDYPVADADESEEQQVKGLSIRQMWRWVAAAHGGNFIINDLGQLRLVPLNALPAETGYLVTETGSPITFGGVRILLSADAAGGDAGGDKVFVGNRAVQAEDIPALEPIGKIVLKVDNNNAYVSKSDTAGLTLEVDCAYGSKQMADDLLTQLQGYVYRPVQAEDALIDPAAELGDGVTIYGVYTILAQKDTLWDLLSAADIGAPGKAELESEFRFTSSTAETFQYQLATTRSLISKNSESVQILVERTDGVEMQYAELSVSLSGISGRVEGVEGEFAAFLLDTDAFYVMDESGNRTAIRGSSIDVTTLNVQNINFSGVISFKELTDTEDLLTDVDTALGYADDALTAVNEITYTYNGKTYIDEDRIMAGTVIAGKLQGGSVGLLDGSGTEFGTITMKTGITYALDIASKTSLRMQSALGFNTFIGNNDGPYLFLTGSPNIPGETKCKLKNGALVIGSESYGTGDPPNTGYEEAGQLYFKLA